MKSKIKYSRFATITTVAIFLILFVGCIASLAEKPMFFILLSIYLFMFVLALLYGVAYLKSDENYVVLGSILKKRKIAMRGIESVELFQPSMGAVRLFASGGFMGYWGLFKEGDVGRYYGFYGKASDCFLVRMKNGDKYVLGCDRPDTMVEYIRQHISPAT